MLSFFIWRSNGQLTFFALAQEIIIVHIIDLFRTSLNMLLNMVEQFTKCVKLDEWLSHPAWQEGRLFQVLVWPQFTGLACWWPFLTVTPGTLPFRCVQIAAMPEAGGRGCSMRWQGSFGPWPLTPRQEVDCARQGEKYERVEMIRKWHLPSAWAWAVAVETKRTREMTTRIQCVRRLPGVMLVAVATRRAVPPIPSLYLQTWKDTKLEKKLDTGLKSPLSSSLLSYPDAGFILQVMLVMLYSPYIAVPCWSWVRWTHKPLPTTTRCLLPVCPTWNPPEYPQRARGSRTCCTSRWCGSALNPPPPPPLPVPTFHHSNLPALVVPAPSPVLPLLLWFI